MSAGPARRIVCCAAKWREVLVCLQLVCAGPVHAEALVGKLIKVSDGDTPTILVDQQAFRVRLSGIDAPDRKRFSGNRFR